VKVVDDKMISLKPVALFRAEETRIRILHVDDFHGFAEPYKPLGSQELLGGAAYLSAAVNRLRKSRWCGASFPFKPHLPIATYK
jgi:2',3'-cyclic-nucleotide 2'-phosphodiesterase (5'-nucleotidase family)